MTQTLTDGHGSRPGTPAATMSARAVPHGVSTSLIAATFLLCTVHATPFADLRSVSNIEVTDGGSFATQVAFLLLFGAAVWAMTRIGLARLRLLATPALSALGMWIAFSMLFSPAPLTSLRRFALTAICIFLSAVILLAARSVRHLALTLALVALGILALSYLSIPIAPEVSTHTTLDLREPDLAGDWRGAFSHKNEAGAAMVLFVFVGLLTCGMGSPILGGLLTVAAAIFLVFTHSKTAVTVLPLVVCAVGLARFVARPALRNAVLLSPLLLLAAIAFGTYFVAPVREVLGRAGLDVTFTGRTEIWRFAIDHIVQRPLTGWGYGAFWRTESTALAYSGTDTWFAQADQAHNAYLDVALFMGLPGLLLTLAAFVVVPLRDLDRAGGRIDATAGFFLMVWLYVLCTGLFETVLFEGNSPMFLLFMAAVFGLRLRTLAPVVARAP